MSTFVLAFLRSLVVATLYLLDEMHKLTENFPELHREFELGIFTVHKTEGMFNGIWTDLSLEQICNKYLKTTLFRLLTEA